ncbi:MAG: transposase family protein [Leptolyngbyaceae cyanobacterium CRU_2_3]|nr:transposase family protein [Leptolyngbyaceae cyanobacterium CRU_2_3]
MPASCVQQVLRQWFEQWGRPQQIQFDHGHPWCTSNSNLPTLFELWLVGLGIDVVWSRVRHPQDNGIVERSHRTTQSWSAPGYCRSLEQLQHSLDQAILLQRQFYPAVRGRTRLELHPDLLICTRPYRRSQEAQLCSLQRVYAYLAQGCWQRKVDASGRISLYNRNYTVARALAKQRLWVRFDASTGDWLVFDDAGREVARTLVLEINPTVICQLQQYRSTAKHRTLFPKTTP